MANENSYVTSDSQYIDPNLQLKQTKQDQSHEQIILSEKNRYELEILDKKHQHELRCKDKELGWLGWLFGGKELTSLNISGFLIFLLLLIGLLLTYIVYKTKEDIENLLKIWSIITPIITLTLGYIFGNKSTKTKSPRK